MMRLDEMLPREPGDFINTGTVSRDDSGLRPCSSLLGIAVGPIQGREISSAHNGHGGSTEDCEMGESDYDNREQIGWRRRKRGGWRGVEKRRRYRLMMVYRDGTVLSYELGGATGAEVQGNTAGEGGYLMV